MRSVVSSVTLTLALGLAISGCGPKASSDASPSASAKDDDKADKKKDKKGDGKDKAANSAAPAQSGSAAAASASASSSAAATAAPQPTDLPAGRSPVPDPKEWATAKEITVKGSTALGCETKIIREWFRVSCHGKNDKGGTPTAIKITKGGGHPDQYIFVTADISSLVFPYTEGIDFEANFGWTDKSHKLVVKWPKGAPQPEIKGTFEGASSPLDRAPSAPGDDICSCDYKLNGTTFCEPYMWGANAGACEAKYKSDCTKMMKCAGGDPTLKP
jgi:hypothetical protein